jgi:competence protein ComEA
MHITEKQLEGAAILVVFTLIVYLTTYLFLSHHSREYAIQHGDKSAGSVVVEITGDSRFNGIYFLPEKSKVSDLLMVAGIMGMEKPNRGILDIKLSTGKAIEIKSDRLLNMLEMSSAKKLMLDIPIKINEVTSGDLILVPGIGKKTAEQIIHFRRTNGGFKKVEDLMKIRGIKEKKFSKLRKYFTI